VVVVVDVVAAGEEAEAEGTGLRLCAQPPYAASCADRASGSGKATHQAPKSTSSSGTYAENP
jgi:hypothetical protein